MAIGNCRLIGIEGSHGTGKSTLALALTAVLKSRNHRAGCLAEREKENPILNAAVSSSDSVIVQGADPSIREADVAIHSELHLLATQIAREEAAARCHELVVCDHTVAGALGYMRLVVGRQGSALGQGLIQGMEQLAAAYAAVYDMVFYCGDLYDIGLTEGTDRPLDADFQRNVDVSIRRACRDVGFAIREIPTGLALEDKVSWVLRRIGSPRGM